MTPERAHAEAERELLRAEAERDKAYRERAALVAYLSANYPAEIVEAPGALADPWPVVYVDTPSGQMTWHVARADLDLFGHLRRVIDAAPGWDGHSTDEKYQRLAELTRTVATGLHGPQPGSAKAAADVAAAHPFTDECDGFHPIGRQCNLPGAKAAGE